MRKLLIVTLLFLGCKETETKEINISTSIDSIINNSVNTLKMADSVGKVCDSTTQKKIEKTVEKIKNLNTELTTSKKEINKLNTLKSLVIHDTVYVEKEKNFWGKKKTKINIISDSVIIESSDSSSN